MASFKGEGSNTVGVKDRRSILFWRRRSNSSSLLLGGFGLVGGGFSLPLSSRHFLSSLRRTNKRGANKKKKKKRTTKRYRVGCSRVEGGRREKKKKERRWGRGAKIGDPFSKIGFIYHFISKYVGDLVLEKQHFQRECRDPTRNGKNERLFNRSMRRA